MCPRDSASPAWRRSLARLASLAPWERGVLLRCAFLLPMASLALRCVPLHRLRAWALGDQCRNDQDIALAQRLGELVTIAGGRLPLASTCLARSLVLARLLRSRGLQAELRVGVKAPAGSLLDAHAWVEHGGTALGEAAGYASFDWPAPRR